MRVREKTGRVGMWAGGLVREKKKGKGASGERLRKRRREVQVLCRGRKD